jgi:hypothetical protein
MFGHAFKVAAGVQTKDHFRRVTQDRNHIQEVNNTME